jgi:hypothetical protein
MWLATIRQLMIFGLFRCCSSLREIERYLIFLYVLQEHARFLLDPAERPPRNGRPRPLPSFAQRGGWVHCGLHPGAVVQAHVHVLQLAGE